MEKAARRDGCGHEKKEAFSGAKSKGRPGSQRSDAQRTHATDLRKLVKSNLLRWALSGSCQTALDAANGNARFRRSPPGQE
ncbi:hypothetical protein A0H81_11129 [Grifola frondosa]|uniref:Uncharacterized protein n=1 Tax=Grifola frondosa TaxID=5627 RepID=A0A1C7LVF2_GRIFR|nr:hypothetical protein A0H81_11129 [Grifola frondosa]